MKTIAIIFQSTRPMRGATRGRATAAPDLRYFNPRAPCGARPKYGTDTDYDIKFQSTRPMRGATPCCSSQFRPCRISIHAPHAGRDSFES